MIDIDHEPDLFKIAISDIDNDEMRLNKSEYLQS